jgi:DNA invertase Pin-like site-specific DNA recombinase
MGKMTTAYSLIRFSTRSQAAGDSFRRQSGLAPPFCQKQNLALDTSLHESDVRNHGVSAFKGDNLVKGALAKFLTLVDAGVVEAGSWLLVEEIDRLTRGVHNKAYGLCLALFEKGNKIATLMDGEVYDLEGINGSLEQRLKLQLRLDSAHDYSKKLSVRIYAAWQGRREAMRAGDGKPTKACPEWLTVENGQFVEKPSPEGQPGRFAIIEGILRETIAGLGKRAIANRLNQEGIPAFRGKGGWHHSSVERIIKSDAIRGIY